MDRDAILAEFDEPQTYTPSPVQAAMPGGMGTPESGYGPGGVDNPAYRRPETSGGRPDAPFMPRIGDESLADQVASITPDMSATKPGAQGMQGSASARYGTGNIPGMENLRWGNTGQLRGYNTAEWGPGGSEGYEDSSIKNTIGKLQTMVDVTQPNAVRNLMALPEFQQAFPEATLVEHPKGDLVDFGDGRPVDLILNAVEGGSGEAWQFLTQDAQGGGGGGMAAGAPMGAGIPPMDDLAEGDILAQIQRALAEYAKGRDPFLTEAITQEF